MLPPHPSQHDSSGWDCVRCGAFYLSGRAATVLKNVEPSKFNASQFSHVLRIRFDANRRASVWNEADLEPFRQDLDYIRPQRLLNNLILWIGRNQAASHKWASASRPALAARIGASINVESKEEPELMWILGEFGQELFKVVQDDAQSGFLKYRLTSSGWEQFEELSRHVSNSRTGFMAMKFNDPELNLVLKDCFQHAARRAGFKLEPLNARPSAGLIDNQIRTAIRSARFVVADLTHANQGAYFEAGFAEGLGLPVVYTCRVDKFKSAKPEERPHFDTNHMHTVLWDPSKLGEANDDLTATIRNTLPAEAKLDD